jgi:Zn-dependent protease
MGIVVNIAFGILGYLFGFEIFAKINLWYAFFNMFPLGNLDGAKIYFGSRLIWNLLATVVLVGAIATLVIV